MVQGYPREKIFFWSRSRRQIAY